MTKASRESRRHHQGRAQSFRDLETVPFASVETFRSAGFAGEIAAVTPDG
jgi:hypothetical protein